FGTSSARLHGPGRHFVGTLPCSRGIRVPVADPPRPLPNAPGRTEAHGRSGAPVRGARVRSITESMEASEVGRGEARSDARTAWHSLGVPASRSMQSCARKRAEARLTLLASRSDADDARAGSANVRIGGQAPRVVEPGIESFADQQLVVRAFLDD